MDSKNKQIDDGIAVVGASALFPGSIGGASFWSNILDGRDFMTEIPADHWLIDDYYDADPGKAGKVYAKRGAFMPKVDFDPMLHGIPPKQLTTTDTAQLLAIIVANKVLADAASVQFGKVNRKDISVILGIASSTELVGQMVAKIQRPHWIKALRDAQLPESQVQNICDRIEATYPEWDESTFPGLLGNVVAGRIANRLDLGGTNCVIDAACASSLGAVAMAIQELRAGHSDLVLTGGVDALNDIFMFMCFSKTPALSPTGDCRPFAESADGTMLGEGIGMVALRRLADAERDGDKIYAVIRGMGSSSDGRAKSIYAPRAEGQELAVRRAYERAGYGAHEVELIEAHGTGTKAGDAAEFDGLRRAFQGVDRHDRQWCALGSVKSQIGHTKAAAGSASLFKTVMALHHKVLPPTIKVDKPNAKMDIENSPFYLNTQTRPWIHAPQTTRKASVSAFGFGGSNFHATLEEYAGGKSTARRFSHLPVQLLLLSGPSAEAVLASAKKAQADLTSFSLALRARDSQLAFDATAPHRLAVLASDAQAATANLAAAVKMIGQSPAASFSLPNRMHYSAGGAAPKVAFLFPGQGSQYVNMGAALALEYDSVRRVWDETAAMDLDPERKLHQVVFPIPVFSDAERDVQAELLTRTHWAQPAIGATSLSMLRLLSELGVQPDTAGGHSYGEITALYAAGAITTLTSLLEISRKRGELMNEAASTPGSMLAIRASAQAVQELMTKHAASGITIANINSPNQVVVAGKTKAVEQFEAVLKDAQLSVKRLPVATAFHTELVAGCAEPFGKFLADVPIATPGIKVYANTTGTPYSSDPSEIRTTLAWQLANPVRFEEMIGRMYKDGYRLFLEVGPGAVLTGMVDDCLQQKPHVAVSLDGRKVDGRAALFNALGVLSAQGVAIDYAALWQSFVPFEAPQDAPKLSVATVKLSGSNYGKPYPPAGGAAALPKPNPEGPMNVALPARATAPVVAAQQPPVQPAASQVMDANWSAAFQIMQQQTLEAQKAFTQTLSDSHQAFLRVSETAFAQLGRLGGAPPGAVPAAVPARVPMSPTAPAVPAQIARSAAPPPPALPAVPQRVSPVENFATQTPVVASAGSGIDFEALLLGVVAEKTGYPIEMLTLDMELESGLGIDSIKRVEILSVLQEKIPQLADVDPAELAVLNTLGEIVAFASKAAPTPPPPTRGSPLAGAPAPEAAGAEARTESVPAALDFEKLLLAVVADKTGYPIEMLTLDMELESGLGIDSIKRVEILSVLQEKIPKLADVDPAELAALNTLGEIVAFASKTAPAAAAPRKAGRQESEDQTAKLGLRRLAVEASDTPPSGLATPGLAAADPLYLVADNRGIAPLLAAHLAVAGIRTAVVATPPADARAVAILCGLDAVEDSAEIQARKNEAVFRHLQACAETMAAQGALLVTVQDTGGDFGMGGAGNRAWSAGIVAAAKTAALEWPKVSVKAIDVATEGREPEAIAAALFTELVAGGTQLEVGLKADGSRVAPRLVEETGAAQVAATFSEDDVIVLSGGARGVTAACLAELLTRTRVRVAILGRTELKEEPAGLAGLATDAELKKALLQRYKESGKAISPQQLGAAVRKILEQRELRSNLKKFAALATSVDYYSVDVGDPDSVAATLAMIRNSVGPIRGLVHAAGVLADKEIRSKTIEQYRAVMRTKLDGFRHLLEATRQDDLTQIVCFSSIAARRGNVGQVDYAMANEVLNQVCRQERARRGTACLVKAIGWGPWAGGMVDPGLEKHFAAMGVALVPLGRGAKFFADEFTGINGAAPEIVYGGGLDNFGGAVGRRPNEAHARVWFHASTHPYLASHAIRTLPVVPLVQAHALGLQAVRAVFPDAKTVTTQNLKVVKGIQLQHFTSSGDWYRIECSPDDATALVRVRLLDDAGVVHYTFDAAVGANPAGTDKPVLPTLVLAPWKLGLDEIYAGPLFHGPDLQVVAALDGISDHGCVGTLTSRSKSTTDGALSMDVLDGGLQLALLWVHERLGQASLPTGFDQFRMHARWLPGESVRCELHCDARTSLMTNWTILYRNPAGELLASMQGLKIHLLPKAAPEQSAAIGVSIV